MGRRSVFNTRVLATFLAVAVVVSIGGRGLGLNPDALISVVAIAAVASIVVMVRHP